MEAAIVHIADILAHGMQFGSSGENFVPPLDERAWELLDMPISSLSPIVDQLDRDLSDIEKIILGGR
jgi:hypothetical protein